MTRLLASLAAIAMAAGLAIAPESAQAQPPAWAMGHHRCPRGSHWVPAHRNHAGRWVPAHCRRG